MTDCYGNGDVMVMENTDAGEEGIRQFALINIGDSPATVTLPADRYCLREWRFRERFGGEGFSGAGNVIVFPPLPARTAVVYETE